MNNRTVVGFLGGPQGAGKGLTCDRIAEDHGSNIVILTMSGLLKHHRTSHGPHAELIARHMDVLHTLVPDDISIPIMEEGIESAIKKDHRYILCDGYPRNVTQARQVAGKLVGRSDIILVQVVLVTLDQVADNNAANRSRGADDSPPGRETRRKIYMEETVPAMKILTEGFGVPTLFLSSGVGDQYVRNAAMIAKLMLAVMGIERVEAML